ncbi:SMI1/KNR4 family protein [Oceanirhabdus seepicola]|uniref:SMI1/KNR4 family protein n=1 Tax=Oceanirhabdus seepicola TaxID=2828781 RepID=A0A9J6P448_9CLOT|nr:SMI1/KNR4 family protein [Oceanirhabdus seepicola]MCM1991323.1 SMI1/KNR4 family protein [Oceanirhabdus seepicola]
MADLKKFIKENEVEFCASLIDKKMLGDTQKEIGVKIGNLLSEYILHYGYLAYDYVEFYGVNARQGMESDMIKQTKYLHENFPCTKPFIALENRGDGDYILIDSNDSVYEFIPSMNNEMRTMDCNLFDYIYDRFTNC